METIKSVTLGSGKILTVTFGKNKFGREKFFIADSTCSLVSQVNSLKDADSSIRSAARVNGGMIVDGKLIPAAMV